MPPCMLESDDELSISLDLELEYAVGHTGLLKCVEFDCYNLRTIIDKWCGTQIENKFCMDGLPLTLFLPLFFSGVGDQVDFLYS